MTLAIRFCVDKKSDQPPIQVVLEPPIHAPDGSLLEKAGKVRDGGSYEQRMGAVECWNAVMDENRYMVRKWNEFIAA